MSNQTIQSSIVWPDEIDASQDAEFALPEAFASQCCRAYDWTEDFARQAIEGYRLFMKVQKEGDEGIGTSLA